MVTRLLAGTAPTFPAATPADDRGAGCAHYVDKFDGGRRQNEDEKDPHLNGHRDRRGYLAALRGYPPRLTRKRVLGYH
jgi:hypothetical protein